MTVCSNCTPWCATTEQQLAVRLKNIAAAPEVKPYECPNCGGIEWASTDALVVKAEPNIFISTGPDMPSEFLRRVAYYLGLGR